MNGSNWLDRGNDLLRPVSEWGRHMLELLQTYSKETFSVVTVLIGFVLNRAFRLRPKLLYSVRHSSSYPVAEPLLDAEGNVVQQVQVVRTASIVAENTGLQSASNVEFTFNWKPPIYTVFPGRAFTAETTEMGRWTLKLGSLAPGETFAIEILSINQDLPLISAMRSDEAEGKLVVMAPQRVWPAWANRTAGALLLIGLATVIYLCIRLAEWLSQ